MTWNHIRYEEPAEHIARIVLARSEMANAQDYLMLSELNEAFEGWEQLAYRELIGPARNGGRRAIAGIVARKPG